MKITALVENQAGREGIIAEHGLSLYIEAENTKLLFDMGQSNAFEENAKGLKIDLSEVEAAVLSHGHYDHGGGLKSFLDINDKARVYLSEYAFEPHYAGEERYIGLDVSLKENHRLEFVSDYLRLNENMELFSCNREKRIFQTDSYGLNMVEDNKKIPDSFKHEIYLLIKQGDKKILISGCSHKGILNIVSWFKPDVLIGGFHFKELSTEGEGREIIEKAAKALLEYETEFYTCHCTGYEQYKALKMIMGNKLNYLACGQTIEI